MVWVAIVAITLAAVSFPGGPTSVSGGNWWAFLFWNAILIAALVYGRLAHRSGSDPNDQRAEGVRRPHGRG